MTIVKQTAVASDGHMKHLRNYLNNDEKVLLRDSLNMEMCEDVKAWSSFMAQTREAFGHNKARMGRDGKPAKNTVVYHQILAFLPDECDVNGGKMSPEACMRYAREYVEKYYPHQQIVMALHKEYCREDKTYRYAVHMAINRTDLETGRRLDEGLSKAAKVKRAARVREMDEGWGLQQVEKGVLNSQVHKKQASHVERALEARGVRSFKNNLRSLLQLAAERASSIVEYRELLDSWGVSTEFRNGRMYAVDQDNSRFSFSVSRLDADIRTEALQERFGEVYVERVRAEYLESLRQAFVEYRSLAMSKAGCDYAEFPQLHVPRPPEVLALDREVKRQILSYWRGGDELRYSLASNVPYARKARRDVSSDSSYSGGQVPRDGQDRDGHSKSKGR